MPVILKDGAIILIQTIVGELRHPDYKHVVTIAEDFTTYATGNNIGKKLKQFNMRETEEAFKQRVALSQMNTPDIVNSVRKPLEKVPRTPANIFISWNGKDVKSSNEKKEQLLEAGSKFWGDKSYEKYISKRLPELDSTDPNSFIVIEASGKYDPKIAGSKKLEPHPFEVNSAEAINYKYKNNVLQWLVVLNAGLMVDDKGVKHDSEVYYIYIDNETVKATEVHKTVISVYVEQGYVIIKSLDEIDIVKAEAKVLYQIGEDESKSRFFVVEVFEHKIGMVPAKRVGTLTDPITRDRTSVPIINPAKSYFEKSIKTMSEFDLTNCLHVFPRLIQYSDACDGEFHGETRIGCIAGKTPSGVNCKSCNGTGFKTHTSAQDAIHIRMPRDLNDIVSLEHVLVYKSPPIDLLKFQQEFAFDKLREAARSAVYNDNTTARTKVVKTATETEINLDDVYDTLKPFADNFSDFFVWGYTCIAAIRDLSQNLHIKHEFPSDFKFQPLSSLLSELELANKNGAASHVKKAINTKIVNKIYIDQPKEVLKIETKDKYFPFPGKTSEEINFILANGKTTKFYETLYSHFDLVFSDLEYESGLKNLDFYQMDESMQRVLIKVKVTQIIGELERQESNQLAEAFGSEKNTEQVEADSKAKLKSSSDGITGILDIQTSYSEGKTDKNSAIAMLETVYGFTNEEAIKILGEPKPVTTQLKIA